ncbi:hypothetical protein CVT25_003583 [Psilocybe cyanescens]|uniref:Uncharacterized protein n=1 Tax=Psilocybe cyanescens TaxID=93625 RepID=A0A409X6R4_PSICY|nr:hypothetical protein CVT25_003583 [Psilocybe cyanescens]
MSVRKDDSRIKFQAPDVFDEDVEVEGAVDVEEDDTELVDEENEDVGENDKEGLAEAILQNCCARFSAVPSCSGQSL